MAKLTILGVGNLLLSDEGAGIRAVEKLQEIKSISKNPNIKIIDGGTLGLDLLPIFEESEKLIIIDCVRGGEEPGTIYTMKLEDIKLKGRDLKLSMHDFTLVDVINLAKALGKKLPDITIYGIEPESFEMGMELTEKVAEAVDKVVEEIKTVVEKEFGN